MKKRWISILLVLLMVLTLLPIGALASKASSNTVDFESLSNLAEQYKSVQGGSSDSKAPSDTDAAILAEENLNLAEVQETLLRSADIAVNDSGASVLAYGTGAFNYLKQNAINKGTYRNGTYYWLLDSISKGDTTTRIFVNYSSGEDVVGLYEVMQSGSLKAYAIIFIPSSLSMPYMGYMEVEDYASAWTTLYSSFNSDSTLTLRDGEGQYTNTNFKDLFKSSMQLLLITAEKEYVENSAGYSIADLGFTAYAAELRGGSTTPTPTPKPTPTPTPKPTPTPTPKPTPTPGPSDPTITDPAAFAYLKQYIIQNGNYVSGDNSYRISLDKKKTGDTTILYVTASYSLDRDEVMLDLMYGTTKGLYIGNITTSLVIPSSLSMPYTASHDGWVSGVNNQGVSEELQYSAKAPIDSSFTEGSKLYYTESSGPIETNASLQSTFSTSVYGIIVQLQNKVYQNSPYSIADLGFTALAEDLGLTPTPKPTPTPTPKPTPTPTPKPTPTPTPKPTPTPTTPGTKNPFKDVKSGAYYYDPVLWAVKNGITNGTSATTFSPEQTCTRGQVVTFLWRASGSPEPQSTKNPFKDVSKNAYYYKAVLWAVEKGITNGTSATTFSPEQPCTRAHVVTFLYRSEGAPEVSAKNPFKDVKSGQYYTNAVLWAVKNEITNGTSATTFSPEQPCTRGQIVTFLYRDKK